MERITPSLYHTYVVPGIYEYYCSFLSVRSDYTDWWYVRRQVACISSSSDRRARKGKDCVFRIFKNNTSIR